MSLEINKFVDIHTHILYGVDDGSRNLQESIAIAKSYVHVGVKRIVATPHFLPGTAWAVPKDKVIKGIDSFQKVLDHQGIDLKVLYGMEIAFHKNLIQRIERGTVLPLGESEHYLIEPSFSGEQESLLSCLSTLLEKGYKLILAHPERIEGLRDKMNIIRKLVEKGLLIQINSGSLLGYFGRDTKKSALHFGQKKCLHFIASDAHDSKKRAPLNEKEWSLLIENDVYKRMLTTCNKNVSNLFK